MLKKISIFPRKKPKQARSQSLVDAIVVAMTRILDQFEFDQSTTGKIAERAGVSIGSLYQYFPNKESLVTAVIESEMQKYIKIFEKKLDELQDQNMEEITHALIRLIIETYLQRKKLTRHLAGPILRFGQVKTLELGRRKVALMIQELLESRKTEIRIQDPHLASYMIVSTVMGMVESLIFDETTKEFEEKVIQETQKLVTNYLL
jgi:AcrR family transcriptional regulator